MQKREIPMKNYIIFIIMTIIVIGGVLYTSNYYALTRDYYLDYSYVSGVITNVDEDSFANYIKERPEIVVYIADSKDASLKSFEKKFKKLIVNNDIKDDIVYLDTSKVEKQSFINKFIDRYFIDKSGNGKLVTPNLIYFRDGKAIKALYNNDTAMSIDDVKSFLVDCEVIEID